jgi:hypothetical protein
MDGKLVLTEKELSASYAYDYADWKRRLRWLSFPRFLLGNI